MLRFILMTLACGLTLPAFAQAGADVPVGKIGDLDLTDYRGKVVLVDFWATWCKPCRVSAPSLRWLNNTFHQEPFVLLSITAETNTRKVRRVVQEDGMNWLHYIDGSRNVNQYFGVQALPTYVLLDHGGRTIWRGTGALAGHPKKLKKRIADAIAKIPVSQ